ncbi:SDR family oxidoreductase [Micromonospora sp. STR1_7]|uniref:SDR family oxidoreductase n=1 Tax=Micromonospora parastrephiae TaxID=2806101 RepID=A0ABS1XPV0_9ACTN|nr:SDR family oxidoreductase [Micromonospora parastrephiae]MBM0231286.1 SDR family oxidoreductase [Micromonospora parastrephiae]
MTILITGATGTVSREVLRELAGRQPVRALVRDASRAPQLDGVDYVVGDLDSPTTLTPAFEGVTTLWLLTPMGPMAPSQSMNAVWAARQAGVRHIVRLSAIGAAHDAPTRNGRLHALSDAELQESGIPWTILRPSYFMQNLLASKAGEHLYGLFGDARVGLIDARDIAAVGAEILAAPERHEGVIYTPTGPESISLDQAAQDIARTLGQPVRYVPQSPEQARDALLHAGLDQWSAEVLAEYRVAYGSGWGDFTNDHVARVAGRPPRGFAEFVRDHREHFASA